MKKSERVGERLPWDSTHFGLTIGRTYGRDAAAAARWIREEGVDCAYHLVPMSDPQTATQLTRAGYRLVDLRVTLDIDPRAALPALEVGLEDARCRAGAPDDLEVLAPVATSSYRDARFYRDGRFAEDRCDALYRIWLDKSLRGERADRVVVATVRGAPAGFVTCAHEGDRGTIGLVGVAEKARGHGLGRSMVAEGLRWLSQAGAERVSVVTQGRNLAAQRLYQASGFRTAELALWLHGWADELTHD